MSMSGFLEFIFYLIILGVLLQALAASESK